MADTHHLLQNWSSRVEDLVAADDHEGAVRFLEEVVQILDKKKAAGGAASELALVAAMLRDHAVLLDRQGFSMRMDFVRRWEMAVNQTTQVADESDSWEEKADRLILSYGSEASSISCNEKESCLQNAKAVAAEDWEAAVHDLPSHVSSLAINKSTARQSASQNNVVKRGRGAFTYGGSGLYSDKTSDSAYMQAGIVGLEQKNDCIGPSSLSTSHVLLVDGFSPRTTTKELEDLFKPFITVGFAIRWLNDTSALVVFSNSAMAREALGTVHSSCFKVQMYDDAVSIHDTVSRRDLEPYARRPVTSTQTAQRMIAGALSNQESGKTLHAKVKVAAKESHEREEQRKHRLLSRQKLREEAWGLD